MPVEQVDQFSMKGAIMVVSFSHQLRDFAGTGGILVASLLVNLRLLNLIFIKDGRTNMGLIICIANLIPFKIFLVVGALFRIDAGMF